MTGHDTMDAQSQIRPAAAERQVELWLRRALSEAHDEVLCEGLPSSWLAMIEARLPRT